MPQSCHPPGMAKGIITGLLRNYYKQNTHIADYQAMAIRLFNRWVARGWSRVTMKDYILTADTKVRHKRQATSGPAPAASQPLTNRERLFIHWKYHQCDVPKQEIRALYNLT